MPAKIKSTRTAPGTRKSSRKRSDRKGSGRTRSYGPKSTDPEIIANSIFALTLKNKPGIEVVFAIEGKRKSHHGEDDYTKMYHDLRKCWLRALKLRGITTKYDPLAMGLNLSTSLASILESFEKEMLPKGFDYNIDKDQKGNYFFTMYKECPVEAQWQAFEIKPIVEYIKKNQKLHDLFIAFIKTFSVTCKIDTWYQYAFGYVMDVMDEHLEFWEENYGEGEEKWKAVAIQCQHEYHHGIVKSYENKIIKAKARTPNSLLLSLKKFNQKNPVVIWMKQACEFMQLPGNVIDYIYPEYVEEKGEGVMYDMQVNIIWNWDCKTDWYVNMQEDYLDAEVSGCGIIEPILVIRLEPNSKEFNLGMINHRLQWPQQLTKLFIQQRECIEKIQGKK